MEVHYLTEQELAARWRLAPSSLQQQRHRGTSVIPFLGDEASLYGAPRTYGARLSTKF